MNRPSEGGCERALNFEHLLLESTKLMLTLELLIFCPYGVPYNCTIELRLWNTCCCKIKFSTFLVIYTFILCNLNNYYVQRDEDDEDRKIILSTLNRPILCIQYYIKIRRNNKIANPSIRVRKKVHRM